jgi:hypothetical protein
VDGIKHNLGLCWSSDTSNSRDCVQLPVAYGGVRIWLPAQQFAREHERGTGWHCCSNSRGSKDDVMNILGTMAHGRTILLGRVQVQDTCAG